MLPPSRRAVRLLPAALLAACFLLASCGDADDPAPVAEPTSDAAADPGVRVKQKDGDFVTGEGVPDDFPTDAVPLVEGDVVAGNSSEPDKGPQTWVVMIDAAGTAEEVQAAAVSELTAVGYEIDEAASGDEAGVFGGTALRKTPYDVVVSAIDDGEGNLLLQYFVSMT